MTEHYARVIINGNLVCTSDLHLGDGDESPLSERVTAKPITDPTGGYNTHATDDDGNPYIPGSSLRGLFLSDYDRDDATCRTLFGYSDPAASDDDTASRRASKVRFYDARLDRDASKKVTELQARDKLPYWCEQRWSLLSHGIAIDPATASVKDGFLFRYEKVPAQSVFRWKLEVDDISHDDLAALIKALRERLDGDTDRGIGRGRSAGWGGIRWEPDDTIDALTQADLANWLEDDKPNTPLPYNPLPLEALTATVTLAKKTRLATLRMPFGIQLTSPLLINEPGYISSREGAPKLEYSRTPDGKARIPAKSLKGAVRAQAQRILATILHQHYDQTPDRAAELAELASAQLFGKEGWKSLIAFDDAVSEKQAWVHHQFFNAVDRFTGGVKDNALFNVKAVANPKLVCECRIDLARAPQTEGWKGLLLLILRDITEEKIAIGWGKAKGYGAFSLETGGGDWQAILNQLRQSGQRPEQWIQALHDELRAMTQAKQPEPAQENGDA